MTDTLIPAAVPNLPELSVSELARALKRTLEERFEHVRVRGEISGFKRHSSGHLYLSLKDTEAVIDAVCWRATAGRLSLKPEDGMEVIATGRITTYPGRSKYQLVIDTLELAGEGALLKLLEDRRKKLAAEGLFSAERKKPLPYLPDVIGVITSPTGAVIRDILHRLADRFPRRVLLWPVAVQGTGAAEQVAAAIAGFNGLAADGPVPRPDLLIVARGGGSLEDLWAFNEEVVVRAAAASLIPLIAAVGHETDTTLIDFAADRRAPTPTAAAEMAVPVRSELLAQVLEHGHRFFRCLERGLAERTTRLQGLARGLPDPLHLLDQATQRLDDWSERHANAAGNFVGRLAERLARVPPPERALAHLVRAKEHELAKTEARFRREPFLAELARHAREVLRCGERLGPAARRLTERAEERVAALGQRLENLSYKRVLARGYALVRGIGGEPLTRVAEATPGLAVTIELHDGSADALIGRGEPAAPRRLRRPDGQGTLL